MIALVFFENISDIFILKQLLSAYPPFLYSWFSLCCIGIYHQ